MIKNLIQLARPYQYTKNLFVFVPAFFAFQLTNLSLFQNAFFAFLSFSLLSSVVYIFNDWVDRDVDAQHPNKSSRPLASGAIKAHYAFIFLGGLLTLGIILAYMISIEVLILVIVYLSLNVLYTLKLKHISIIDIVVISTGFVIRLFVGSASTDVVLSHWIIIMTFLLAIFISLAKRRDDVLIYLKTEKKMRDVIDGYNLKFLDSALIMSASITIVAYIMWSISPEVSDRLESNNLYLSSVFVVLGILRYMQISFVEEKSGNPSKILLNDRFILLILFGWVSTFLFILYM